MAFINEYIPTEDYKRYDFDKLNKRPKETSGSTPADHWTIDRDADIWLRTFYVEMDHTEPRGVYTGISIWDFYWKGYLMQVKLKYIETGGGIGKHCCVTMKLLYIDIPEILENMRSQIIRDLEYALTAYKDGGVLSSSTSFSFTLVV